jgi:hypothetical protein
MSETLIVKIIGDLSGVREAVNRTEIDDAKFIQYLLVGEGCNVEVEVKYE